MRFYEWASLLWSALFTMDIRAQVTNATDGAATFSSMDIEPLSGLDRITTYRARSFLNRRHKPLLEK